MNRRIRHFPALIAWLLVPSCQPTPSAPPEFTILEGTLRAGSDLGEMKLHCPGGLYLVADSGDYLVDQSSVLLLRVAADEQPMYADRRFLNQRVVVRATTEVGRPECDALICTCESALLVGDVQLAAAGPEDAP